MRGRRSGASATRFFSELPRHSGGHRSRCGREESRRDQRNRPCNQKRHNESSPKKCFGIRWPDMGPSSVDRLMTQAEARRTESALVLRGWLEHPFSCPTPPDGHSDRPGATPNHRPFETPSSSPPGTLPTWIRPTLAEFGPNAVRLAPNLVLPPALIRRSRRAIQVGSGGLRARNGASPA